MGRIIMVEDDPMISEIYQKKFESADLEITVVGSGKEFLRKVLSESYDLALLDMVLPEMNGIEVLQELKKDGSKNPEMKVFMFSNLTSKEDKDKAMENGAYGYITKTQYNPSQLVEEVKRMLREFTEQEKNEARRNKENSESNEENNPKEIKNKKRILFIEDEKVFLELFSTKLESEGYEVECAENGAWGVKEAINKDFDIIITDMVMPAMEGTEIIRKLRMEEKTKNIPIIVISASSTDEKIKEVKDLGIHDFFLKTRIVPSDLARRIGEILK
jgi:DNA-binding response OmpR family regulator